MTSDPITDKVKRPSSQTGIAPNHVAKFADLSSAGRKLAVLIDRYFGHKDTIVLAIARGGVPVGREVANHLDAPLDIIAIRRLLAPHGPGSQICAVNVCGTVVVDQELVVPSSAPKTPQEFFIEDALQELAQRERACRGNRPALNLAGKTVLLIDNGIHTGSTVLASIRALRTIKPAGLVVAVPVAAPSSRAAVEAAADDVICLAWPEPFGHVGLFYSDFNVPNEEQICDMLDHVTQHVSKSSEG
jgi:putative phosphoribosyl transferase